MKKQISVVISGGTVIGAYDDNALVKSALALGDESYQAHQVILNALPEFKVKFTQGRDPGYTGADGWSTDESNLSAPEYKPFYAWVAGTIVIVDSMGISVNECNETGDETYVWQDDKPIDYTEAQEIVDFLESYDLVKFIKAFKATNEKQIF